MTATATGLERASVTPGYSFGVLGRDLLGNLELEYRVDRLEGRAGRAGGSVIFRSAQQELHRAAGRLDVADALSRRGVGADRVDGEGPREDRHALQDDAGRYVGSVLCRVRPLDELDGVECEAEEDVHDVARLDAAAGGLPVGNGDRHRAVVRRAGKRVAVRTEGRGRDDNEDLAVGAAELSRQDRLANRDADDGDLADGVLRPREGGRGDDLAVHLDELQVRRRDLRLR